MPVTETQSVSLVKAIMSSCWDRGGCQVEQDIASIAQQAKLDRGVSFAGEVQSHESPVR